MKTSTRLALLIAVILCAWPAAARAEWALPQADSEKIQRLVLPPENLLVSGFSLREAKVERVLLRARFAADDGRSFDLVLRHPSLTEGALEVTERFSVHVEGEHSAGFAPTFETLVAQIRANEEEWSWVQVNDAVAADAPPDEQLPGVGGRVVLWAILLLVASVGAVLLIAGRPKRPAEAVEEEEA